MTYCMADIHGNWKAFQAMLGKIGFGPEDTLYIIGDVIDRGPDGIPLLWEILSSPNITLLLGNHEQMCLDTLGRNNRAGARALWLSNGGESTFVRLMYGCSLRQRMELLESLARLPDCMDIEVEGRTFHLVHGRPGGDTHTRIWERPTPGAPSPLPGRTVIVGHTPTPFFTGDEDSPAAIYHGDGLIAIDCGCGDGKSYSRLACLRLEDMAEFYVEE